MLAEVTYYTDPLCSWCWAFEPVWQRCRHELGDRVQWCYRMGGMLADWQSYEDPLNDVAGPAQMGPHWLYVSRLSGVPIDARLWHDDPPGSSYPACLAVKAAARQGGAALERYLRRVREAAMLERRNIARREVLLELAHDVDVPGFSVSHFERALEDGSALEAFRQDVQECQRRGIGRFPTLTVRRPGATEGVILVGYRPYERVRAALAQVAPELYTDEPPQRPEPATAIR